MNKFIDAEELKTSIKTRYDEMLNRAKIDANNATYWNGKADAYRAIYDLIDSLQQDEKAVELEMCSQAYWEERGWMMIPPDVTLKGIESLLEQVRKKLQQEQPQVAGASKMEPGVDLEKEIENEWRKCCPTDEGMGLESANVVKEQFDAIAYRLIELGKNARK